MIEHVYGTDHVEPIAADTARWFLGASVDVLWESAFENDYDRSGRPEWWNIDQSNSEMEKRKIVAERGEFWLIYIAGNFCVGGYFGQSHFGDAVMPIKEDKYRINAAAKIFSSELV